MIHQFYKELVVAKKKGKPAVPLIRFFPKYIFQNRFRRDRLELGMPWLTTSAVLYLENSVKPGMRVFEYGSGASTVFFAKKGTKIYSVDHDEMWHEKISNYLKRKNLSTANLILRKPVKNKEQVEITSQKDLRFSGYDYSDYVNSILETEINDFDIILIDGRARVQSLEKSLSKLKKGGLLIFDNADREEYLEGLEALEKYCVLSNYEIVDWDLFFSQTNIYRIP